MDKLLSKYNKVVGDKKQQTTYKIKYVSTYVKKWLFVMVNRKETVTINFIDCMCNAGIYKDGDLGTSMEVLKLFIKYAATHANIKFNLYLNDIDKNKLTVINDIINLVYINKLKNLAVHIDNKDANIYLANTNYFNNTCKAFGAATLLFVDPYDFGTIKKQSLKAFLTEYYCELFYNVFTSDFMRNSKAEKNNKKMIECWGDEVAKKQTNDEFIQYIRTELKVGKITNTFAYAFRITTNAELYQIIFFTPNICGLEKIKEAYWDVFKGKEAHKNEQINTSGQISLFTEADDEKMRLADRSQSAKEMLLKQFANTENNYSIFATYLLENTMLKESHLLENVFKPLIEKGLIIKRDILSKKNYKKDRYLIKGNVTYEM